MSTPAPSSPEPSAVVRLASPARPEPREVGELPQTVNLNIYQGVTFAVRLIVTQGGEPADLTGVVADSQIRLRPSSEAIMATFGIAVEDNVIRLSLTDAQTADMSPRGGVWDARIARPDFTTVVARGRVTVAERVTR